ncbi:MAG: Fertility inhibition FinO [Ramlibacter sp.]|nr:Fertility inhibition FinO [Ramlibacter sp.]
MTEDLPLAPTPAAAPTAEATEPRRDRRRSSRGKGGKAAAGNTAQASGAPAGNDQAQASHPAKARAARSLPVLEQLAALYPALFGETFLPLKRGIFQDLLDAQPGVLAAETLKDALAFHTRSTRYLTAVAAGLQRHDLQGQPVEAMAPEHVHHALLEVFRRRQGRTPDDLRPKLRARIAQAFEASGLAREDYAQRVRGRDEAANTLLDEALAEVAARAAREEALLRAFEASGEPVEAFAGMYGLEPRAAARMLEQARQRRAPAAA